MARKKFRQKSNLKQLADDEAKKNDLTEDKEAKPKISFWRRVLKALPLMLLALLFTFIFNRAGLFTELETTFLDTEMEVASPLDESKIIIVDITSDDFQTIFHSKKEPLNPSDLQALIKAIAEAQPCVIGVDIDTSFNEFQDFNADNLPNIIWARSYKEILSDDKQEIVPQKVLGRDDPSFNEKSGLPKTQSEKGVTRYYSRLFETTGGILPSFAWSILKEAKSRNCNGIKVPDLEETTEPLIIQFSRGVDGMKGAGRAQIPASQILSLAKNHWQDKSLLKDKIVLLGGSYGRDERLTPLSDVQKMKGFNIIANVIETDLGGGGIKQPSLFSRILLQIFDGFLLIALFQIFTWRRAVLLSLPFIIILSLICSFLTYYSFSHWIFFAPVMVGVVLTELFDRTKDHFKKHYKRELKETYEDLGGHPDEKPSDGEED